MPETNNQPIEPQEVTKKWHHKSFRELFHEFSHFLEDLVDIRDGMDQKGTLENIHNNKRMKGANAILLMCSIMVASLGLDLNSPAVIIGAMLISPLMSPILGIGLGVGINDRRTLFISLRHFFISIIIAILTSFLYFKFTPFGDITDEIRGRTEPTLLDGMVAIFGGIAGIISITRKDKSNAIPGVAIATALMPPLCVAGYGLANQNWEFFRNAFYLFFLNSSFIAMSTYLIIRILRFRYKKYINEKERKRTQMVMIAFSIIILYPAVSILLDRIGELDEKREIETFLGQRIKSSTTTCTEWKTNQTDEELEIDIQLIGQPIPVDSIEILELELEEILEKPIEINTYQSREIPFGEIQKLKKELGGFKSGFANLEKIQAENVALKSKVDSLENQVDFPKIFEAVKINYPLVEEIGFTRDILRTNFEKETKHPTLLVKWSPKKSSRTKNRDEQKLKAFVALEAKLDSLVVLRY